MQSARLKKHRDKNTKEEVAMGLVSTGSVGH
jgi:hypothetical protein